MSGVKPTLFPLPLVANGEGINDASGYEVARTSYASVSRDERFAYATAIAKAVNSHATLLSRVEELEKVIREADKYLSPNALNSICSGSILHRKFRAVLKKQQT